MTVILAICPDRLCTIQASVVCIHEPGRSVGIPVMRIAVNKPIQRERERDQYIPNDLNVWNIIQACEHIGLHSLDIGGERRGSVTELSCSPILLNEIELAVIFGVEITEVTTVLDELGELRFLSNEIGLIEYDSAAAAAGTGTGILALESSFDAVWILLCILAPFLPAHCRQFILIKTSLLQDTLHPFEPARHCWVVIWIVELLRHADSVACGGIGDVVPSISHARAVLVMGPAKFGFLGHFASRESVSGAFLMGRCIIKVPKSFGIRDFTVSKVCFEDIDRIISLLEQVFRLEPSITGIPSLKDDSGLSDALGKFRFKSVNEIALALRSRSACPNPESNNPKS